MLDFTLLSNSLLFPLGRLLLGLAAGLLLATLLESLRWTEKLASLTAPLARLGHFSQPTAAAFAMAFVSPAAANALLSESYAQQMISRRELMLANLFNGLPASLKHMPTIFFLTWPAVGMAAVIYTGLTLLAALGRTLITALLGRALLPEQRQTHATQGIERQDDNVSGQSGFANWKPCIAKAWRRFCARIPKLVFFTAPFYVLMWLCQQYGLFQAAENWLATHLSWLLFLKPQAIGIVLLQIVAETGATLGAASAALQDGSLAVRDIALALLVGNILATPMRVLRHQFPAYAGFFRPMLALRLIVANQALRAASLALVTFFYAIW